MVMHTSESVEDGPRMASEASTTIAPDLTSDCVEIEDSKIVSNNIKMEESPEVKRATDKIVSNAVSIDVITPQIRGHSDSYCCATGAEKSPQIANEENEGTNRDNVFTRYFKRKTAGMTQSQIAILCIFPFVEFFAATVISLQGPFYPAVAREKGATPSEYGLVFGSFEFVVFIMAPIYGAKMGILNPHRLFNYGIFTTSLTCVLFGFVHHVDDRVGFIFLSLLIRIVEAIGDAAFVTASFSIIAVEFPDTVATTFAMMETFYGLGMIAGPVCGGMLYSVGGFTLPFAVMGGLLFISALATYMFITRVSTADTGNIVSSSSFGMFKMLKIPAIALTAYGTFAAATGIGFLCNNLEHHLTQFGLTEFQVGSIYMLNGGVYALSAPVWGKLCDSTSQLKVFSLIGAMLTILGFILVGPLPFFPSWSPSIPVICIGLIVFGLGLGSTLVSAFIQFLQDALATGHPDDVNTHGLVSGLWTSMTALGFFVGPTIGGFLDHSVGFRWGTLFILMEQLVVVGLLIHFFLQLSQSPSKEESSSKDNLDDIVITYALKMNTPKPKSRKKSSSSLNQPTEYDNKGAIISKHLEQPNKPDDKGENLPQDSNLKDIEENVKSASLNSANLPVNSVANGITERTTPDGSGEKVGYDNSNFVADH